MTPSGVNVNEILLILLLFGGTIATLAVPAIRGLRRSAH
jgi:hypothetical protein